MRYIKSVITKMRIEESAAKKQRRIDSGRDVVVGVNKYWINKENMDDRDNVDVNRDLNDGGENAVNALRINKAAVRGSQTRRLGEIRANRDNNEAREALDRLERSNALSKDDNNNGNGTNNINNSKNGDGNVGRRRREEINTSKVNHPQNLLRMYVEAGAVQCMLGEISYALEKRWGRHGPSYPIVSSLYIASFCGGGLGGGNKGGGKKTDNNNNNDEEEDEEDE